MNLSMSIFCEGAIRLGDTVRGESARVMTERFGAS